MRRSTSRKHGGYVMAALILLVVTAVGCQHEPDVAPMATPYDLVIPSGFPPMEIPDDNPMTVEGVELGRHLFYEEKLSGDNTMACASCHFQSHAFTDEGNQFSTGIDGLDGNRNAMALINMGWGNSFFWDGRAMTLEEQILMPVRDPIEMHEIWSSVASKLSSDPFYTDMFLSAFGSEHIDSLRAAKAIAQFLRTMISSNSKYDKAQRFEDVLTPEEQAGFFLFQAEGGPLGQIIPLPGGGSVVGQGGADCFHCHAFAANLFTDEQFHNNALDSIFTDLGRYNVTGNAADMGKFKTPTLRNVALTAPYMHDGRFNTLEEVIDHYNDGGHPSSTVDPFMKFTGPGTLELTPLKKQQLLAFLNALTDMEFVNDPRFQDPNP